MNRKFGMMTTIFAVLLLAALLPVKTWAANESLPPQQADLVIHKYLMEDVTQANPPSDGQESTNIPEGAKPLNGITFHVYPVIIEAEGKIPVSGIFTLKPGYGAPTSFIDGEGNEFSLGSAVKGTTAGDGSTRITGLSGIYLIVEQENIQVASPAEPFVAAVPMTNPEGNGWLDEVHVYPKNENLNIEKTVDLDSVTIGQTVKYSITPTVPAKMSKVKQFDIVDVLDSALDFQNGSLAVKGAATKSELAKGAKLAATTHYTGTYDAATRTLIISFNAAGRAYIEEKGMKYLQIDFDTKTNAEILKKEQHVVENRATIHFTNKFDQVKEYITEESKDIHTGTIAIQKEDIHDQTKVLAGAKFKIAASEEKARAKQYLRKDSKGEILDVKDSSYNTAADWEVTTNIDGKAVFEGIRDYVLQGEIREYQSYWLVETQAPQGYYLLETPQKITFTTAANKENSYTVNVAIKNNRSFSLPKTGGTGTLLFTAGGLLLIGFAAVLVLNLKKQQHS